MSENIRVKSVSEKLEYIRIRLFLMASFEDFDEMLKQKVELYAEHDFVKEISRRLDLPRRKITKLQSLAKAKLKAIENEKDKDFYTQMANEILSECEIDINVLDINRRKYEVLSVFYS